MAARARIGFVLVVGVMAGACLAWPAGGQEPDWLTAFGRPGDMRPLVLQADEATRSTDRGGTFFIDLAISLYNDPGNPNFPEGDSNGNAQGATLSQQDRYERVIQHFADAIYEATNGAHKIRRVRFFTDGRYPPGIDIVWEKAGQPNLMQDGGVLVAGSHINMYDVYLDGVPLGDLDLLDTEENRQRAGYLLAHLWMRYFYGLGAEYAIENDDIPVEKSLMNNPFAAVAQNDPAWLNLSAPRDGLFPFDDFENTRATEQHRLYLSSIWETLARDPQLDPKPAELSGRPPRLYFPELVLSAPFVSNPPTVEFASLPGSTGTSRSDLDVIWIQDFLMTVLILDISGSMAGEKLDNVKIAANLFLDMAEDDSTRVGIVTFSSTAQVLYPVTLVTPTVRASMQAAINALEVTGSTAMGDGILLGLEQMSGNGADRCVPVAIVLSDGLTNTGVDPMSLIPAYQAAQIPLFTFAYGEGADAPLMQLMAEQTGGEFFLSATTLEAVARAFTSTAVRAAGFAPLVQERTTINPTVRDFEIPVDSTLKRLDVSAVFDRPATGLVYELQNPDGAVVTPTSAVSNTTGTAVIYTIADPDPGVWTLTAATVSGLGNIDLSSSGVADGGTIRLSVSSVLGANLSFPEPIVIQADLSNGLPIAGADVIATITRPAGIVNTFTLTDDGVAPDRIAGDGRYTATAMYGTDGTHRIDVTARGSRNRAYLTHQGTSAAPSLDATGAAAGSPRPDEAIADEFMRQARVNVVVSGVSEDDHSDLPGGATVITPDNRDIRGVINTPGDFDMFVFQVTPLLARDTFVIRVTDRGRDFTPHLTVFEDPGSFDVLADVSLQEATVPSGYLGLPMTALGGTTLYFEIRDEHPTSSGGTYTVSVGPLMPSDVERADSGGGGGGGGGGGCFIATAAYGTPLAAELDSLRTFRDAHLLPSPVGTAAADVYYRVSPPFARFLAEHENLRAVVRVVLVPVIGVTEGGNGRGVLAASGMLLTLLFLGVSTRRHRTVRRRRVMPKL